MKINCERSFQYSVVGMLLLTAAIKVYSASGKAHILDFPDPLMGLPNRSAMLIVATIELIITASLISRMHGQVKHLLVAWLGCNFLLYRLALAILKPGTYCKCLGTLTDNLHLNERAVGYVLTVAALYLVIGSMGFYLHNAGFLAGNKLKTARPMSEAGSLAAEPPADVG